MKKTFSAPVLAVLTVIILFSCVSRSSASAFTLPTPAPIPTATPIQTAVPTPEPTPTPAPGPYSAGIDLCGKHYAEDTVTVSLEGADESDIELFIKASPYLEKLRKVNLGSDESSPLQWETVSRLVSAAPQAQFNYKFTLYGREFEISDTVLDINHCKVEDCGALVRRIIPCMKNLQKLDMDFCGVSDEDMASIRDDFPEIDVVWRVWFGSGYSVRTDVEKILASCPTNGGNLTDYNTGSLKYCTKVKYLDVGHNGYLSDVSFLSYMPDLEVCIIAMCHVKTLEPLAACTKLEFLEAQVNKITDLSPLSGLTGLHHLNIFWNYELSDLSPIYSLTELERLWIGFLTHVPQEQLDEFKELVPDCEINSTSYDPHDNWRYGNERYDLLVEQFGYDKGAYSYSWLDPLYEPHD